MLDKANAILETMHPGSTNRVILEIKTTRTDEETPESMSHFLASMAGLKRLLVP